MSLEEPVILCCYVNIRDCIVVVVYIIVVVIIKNSLLTTLSPVSPHDAKSENTYSSCKLTAYQFNLPVNYISGQLMLQILLIF